MSIKQFYQELSNGLPSPSYLLCSKDYFLLYDSLSSIKERFHKDGFDFDLFDLKSPDYTRPIEEIVDILNTPTFFSSRRVVAIENIQELSKKEAKRLEDYLKNPSDNSLLIMLYGDSSPKLFESINPKALKIININIYEKDIPFWLKVRAEKKGIRISDKAIKYLITSIGTDLGMLCSELEKFSVWNSPNPIEISDIKDVVYAGAEYKAFDLVNALINKDPKEVFRIYGRLQNVDHQMLLGALNYQYAAIKSKTANKAYYSKIFRLLHEADIAIKTSHSLVIEDLIIKLLKL